MSALDEVMGYMSMWGWSDGGGRGSVKHGLYGEVLARHGDPLWMRDVNNAVRAVAANKLAAANLPAAATPLWFWEDAR